MSLDVLPDLTERYHSDQPGTDAKSGRNDPVRFAALDRFSDLPHEWLREFCVRNGRAAPLATLLYLVEHVVGSGPLEQVSNSHATKRPAVAPVESLGVRPSPMFQVPSNAMRIFGLAQEPHAPVTTDGASGPHPAWAKFRHEHGAVLVDVCPEALLVADGPVGTNACATIRRPTTASAVPEAPDRFLSPASRAASYRSHVHGNSTFLLGHVPGRVAATRGHLVCSTRPVRPS
jgi:hypothetical protein